ncbi:hypothetical protein HHK36_021031 [Tetracentron sinense]|uniref:PUM-HD domain-containing protein n=1 Tax=Tetracentron sinense TaxID=13715 RepID=A0A835DA98_TETSI|nr:hypothetical protein HHK36_021031 [Tetracentron sinense]
MIPPLPPFHLHLIVSLSLILTSLLSFGWTTLLDRKSKQHPRHHLCKPRFSTPASSRPNSDIHNSKVERGCLQRPTLHPFLLLVQPDATSHIYAVASIPFQQAITLWQYQLPLASSHMPKLLQSPALYVPCTSSSHPTRFLYCGNKALEVIELDQKSQLVHELDGQVMTCVYDQNGNHVIQKCIECVSTEKIGFIISAFCGQVATLSTHPYGCRVIQRVLEHCTDELQSRCIVDEILESACALAQDQYGNYVTQHVLERGKPHERSQIIGKLTGKIVQMSQHKFASNVIEKCLEHGDTAERELMIEEIVGQTEGNDNLLIMMKDQFANYVVQKILETCTDKQREILLHRIRIHLPALKKYTYGKHIVSRFEQVSGEGRKLNDAGFFRDERLIIRTLILNHYSQSIA